ncbi:MAG: type II toxin-antitoxin system RelE/ParE family toxin [Chitinophagales bacterium]
MAEVIWSPRSLKDINEIAEYIAKDSIQYAEEQVKVFFEKARMLEKFPSSGRMMPELQIASIRQILCGNYKIIFEIINSERVAIITVHHQSRLLKNNPALKKLLRRKRNK